MYPAIDVCLVASRDEGGPRAVLESMATRVPLVTTRVGQAADLVRSGENGWMVEPEDVDGLVDAIGRIAAAPRPRARPRPRRRAACGRGELVRRAPAALAVPARGLRDAPRVVKGAGRARARRYGRAAAGGRAFSRAAVHGRGCGSSTAGTASRRRASPSPGGTAKLQKLAARLPNRPADFSLLYLGTT